MTAWYPFLNYWSDIWAGYLVYRTVESAGLILLISLIWNVLKDRIPVYLVYSLYVLVLVKLLIPTNIPWSGLGTTSWLSAFTARTQCSDSDGWLLIHEEGSNPMQPIQGSLIGNVSWTLDGKLGRGLYFDGGYVQLGDRENDGVLPYGPEDSFTWTFWIKPEGIPRNDPLNHWMLLSRRRFLHSQDHVSFFVGYCPDGRIDVSVSSSDTPGAHLYSNSTIHDEKWYHIAVVRETRTGEFRLYIDGKVENTIIDAGWDLSAACSFRLGEEGKTYGGTSRYYGFMDEVRIYDFALADKQIAAVMSNSPHPFPFRSVVLLMWGCVVLVLLLYQCYKEWKTYRIFQAVDELDPNIPPFDLQELVKKSGVKRPIRWAVSKKFDSPAAYGIFHPVIVFPPDYLHIYSVKNLQWMIMHELSHIKRYDQLISFCQIVVRALFFFHPLVYWMDMKLYQCRESMSDDYGLEKTGIGRIECGECLLQVAEHADRNFQGSSSMQGIISHQSIITWRMHRICDEKRTLQVTWDQKSYALLALAAVTVFMVGLYTVHTERAWEQIRGEGPSARIGHTMAYDSHNQSVLLFGGVGTGGSATWQWDGIRWDRAASTGPSPRTETRIVYDQKRKQMVLFGGRSIDYTGYYGDTWIWNQQEQSWTGLNISGPEARSGHAMAYDSGRETVVLFGGEQGPFKRFGDTWEWDGKQWTRIANAGASPRSGHAMAYDPVRKTVLLMGGKAEQILGDTWEWNGTLQAWTQLSHQGQGTLQIRMAHTMAYDPRLQRIVLYGGHSGTRSRNETWLWDNQRNTWIQLLEGKREDARAYSSMVFDESKNVMIRFGGVDLFEEGTGQAGTWVF